MVDTNALKAANAKRWMNARLTVSGSFLVVAKHLVDPGAKARYRVVAKRTGVPWAFIAVVHQRECSRDWNGSLAQGDPWKRISVRVPAGRGPFRSWEEAAIDALVNCAPRAASNRDWSIGGTLTMLERYNGLGYAARGRPSPYLWSGTDQYAAGKYIRDGVYDPNAVDRQLGCAGLLVTMMALDPAIRFADASSITSHPARRPAPLRGAAAGSIKQPSPGPIGAFIASMLAAVFRRK